MIVDQNQLIDIFESIKRSNGQDKFCFLLGAGASRSSGIPIGKDFSKKWYNDLEEKKLIPEKEFEDWKKQVSFDDERIGDFYYELYAKRFEVYRQSAIDEFIKVIEDAQPGIGYTILSQILVNEKHNIVITTNFDSLVEEAIRLFTRIKPITFGHETLINYVPLNIEKPIIIKLHRDVFFDPINEKERSFISIKKWTKKLEQILTSNKLLVVGYAGNDDSLIEFLKKTKKRKEIYWCKLKGEVLSENVKTLFKPNDLIINIEDFDDLMCNLYIALGYNILDNVKSPEQHPLIKNANDKLCELNNKIQDVVLRKLENCTNETVDCEYLKLLPGSNRSLHNKKDIYKALMENFYDSAKIFFSYANYIAKERPYCEEAKEYYNKAIEGYSNLLSINNEDKSIRKNLAKCYNSLATYLITQNDLENAKKYYHLSVDCDPQNVENSCEFAIFLYQHDKDNVDELEKFFQRSVDLKPKNSLFFCFYIDYLLLIRKRQPEAKNQILSILKKKSLNNDIRSILWYFLYLYYPEYLSDAERNLDDLIKEEIEITWDFLPHLEVINGHHSNMDKVNEYLRVFNQ